MANVDVMWAARDLDTPRKTGASSVRRAAWWSEILLLMVGYAAYATIRNTRGVVSEASMRRAMGHARLVVRIEGGLGIHIERAIQSWFLHFRPAVEVLDVLYATAHVLVTLTVIIAVWWLAPARYRRARTALLIATGIALVVFAVFPTAPPRMFPDIGARDTLATVGGLWSFRTPMIERISDPLAAMPSLHIAWALWCTFAVLPLCRRRRSRAIAIGYPAVVSVVVIVTGNHWILDVVAGAMVGLAGWYAAGRLASRQPAAGTDPVGVDEDAIIAPPDALPLPVPAAVRAAP